MNLVSYFLWLGKGDDKNVKQKSKFLRVFLETLGEKEIRENIFLPKKFIRMIF